MGFLNRFRVFCPETIRPLSYRQREAAVFHGANLRLLAGAGAGKTRTLAHRIAYEIEQLQFDPGRILAVSFTGQAADELSSRVFGKTGQALPWSRTIHSAALRMIRENHAATGLPSDFSVADEKTAYRMIREIAASAKMPTYEASAFVHQVKATGKAVFKNAPAAKQEVFRTYQEALRESGKLDFDDLVMKAVKMLLDHPQIREHYRDRFQSVIVDEFQDVDPMQLELVRLLTNNNLAAVGDEDQAIYGWRFATLRGILEFETIFGPGTRTMTLGRNYRCPQNVLKAGLSVIQNNRERINKLLYTRKPTVSGIETPVFHDAEDEADGIAARVSNILHAGAAPEQVAILTRTNTLMREIGKSLRDADLPYDVEGSREFFDLPEVQDALAVLSVASGHPSPEAIRRVRFIDAGGAAKIEALDASSKKTPGAAVRAALSAVRYDAYLERVAKTEEDLQTKQENVSEIIRLADQDRRTPQEFLAACAAASMRPKRGQKIHLSTIHAAKGREFDHVIVAGCEKGLLPLYGGDPEEERRLMYVAMTRTRKTLTLSRARNRKDRESRESGFLKEAGIR